MDSKLFNLKKFSNQNTNQNADASHQCHRKVKPPRLTPSSHIYRINRFNGNKNYAKFNSKMAPLLEMKVIIIILANSRLIFHAAIHQFTVLIFIRMPNRLLPLGLFARCSVSVQWLAGATPTIWYDFKRKWTELNLQWMRKMIPIEMKMRHNGI